MAKFSEVLTIVNGRNQKQVVCDDGKYPIYGSGGIMGYANDYICKAETVVIGRKGSINKPIFVETPFWNVDTAFGLCANSEKLNPKYLYYFCEKFDFEKLNTTVTIPSLTKSNLLNVEIPLPNLEKQKQIVELLDKVTSLIFLRKQQLSKFDELVKARFVEMFGERSSIRPQKLKEVTRRVKVGFVGTCEKYYTDNTGVPMLRTTNITSHGIDLKDLKYVTRTFHEKNLKSRVHKGDLLIARHGSNGQANVYCGDEAQCLNAIIIEPDHNITNPIFLENLINSRSVKRQIEKELVGSTQHVLNTTTLANVEVKIPAIKEQQVFAAFVERVNQQKQTVQQSLEKLELMKKALMQEYFG